MAASAKQLKAEIVDALAVQLADRLRGDEAELAQRFVRAYFHNVAPEDLAERDPLDLYGAALAQLRFSQEREPGAAKVRVYNPKVDSTAGNRRIRSSRSSTTTCRSWSTASRSSLPAGAWASI